MMRFLQMAGLVLGLLLVPVAGGAVTLEAFDSRISINGYLDLQYTYMGKLPIENTPGPPPITAQDSVSTLDQDRLNLLLKADRGRYRWALNLYSHRAFSTGTSENRGGFEVMEAYGEYRHSAPLQLRAGHFLAPFGIYNQIRFASSLFAPVVLPTVYEPLPSYADAGGLPHVVPEAANLMLTGTMGDRSASVKYAVYIGSGERSQSGADKNRDMAAGARLMGTFGKGHQGVGLSYYTADDDSPGDPVLWGRRHHLMASVDLNAGPANLQAEYLDVRTETDAADVKAYYARLSYRVGKATPFAGFDYFEDRSHLIYGGHMERWSAGVGYEAASTLYLKAEYHLHRFEDPAIDAAGVDDRAHMVRLAAIMVF